MRSKSLAGRPLRLPIVSVAAAVATVPVGCSTPTNPSFPLSVEDARLALDDMSREPKPLERPLVIVGGYGDPGFAASDLTRALGRVFEDDRILSLSFTEEKTFADCRTSLVEAVVDRFGSGVDGETVEVDVVANSMGGLIAIHAADSRAGAPSLRIARLYTLSTPYLGSDLADSFPVNDLVRDMRSDSEFLRTLHEAIEAAGYAIVPYVRLGDTWVGTANTAPPGQVPFWTPNRPFEPAHLTAYSDPRFHADLARRLRGEQPFSSEPRSPLPE